jgi:hypothetical protein
LFEGNNAARPSGREDMLPQQMRGRALYRMSQAQHFTMDDHSEGVFEYADCLFHWKIGVFAGQRSITLAIGCEACK